MATDVRLKEALPEITEAIVATYTECHRTNHLGHKPLPSREAVQDIVADFLEILYPGFARRQNLHIGGRVRTHETHDGHRSFTGELVGASDAEVTIAAPTGVVAIAYDDITRSNLVEE